METTIIGERGDLNLGQQSEIEDRKQLIPELYGIAMGI